MSEPKPPKQPADWTAIEMHFRAGMRTLEDIGKEFGVTKGRISQIAKKKGWERDLAPKIAQRTAARVARAIAEDEVNKGVNDPSKLSERRLVESEVVELNVQVNVAVLRKQKGMISRLNGLVQGIVGELELLGTPEGQTLVEMMIEVTAPPREGEDDEAARKRVTRAKKLLDDIASVHTRADTIKRTIEAEEKVIRMEREAYGIEVKPEAPESPILSMLRRVSGTTVPVVYEPEDA